MTNHIRDCGAASGRGVYLASQRSDEIVATLRIELSRRIKANSAGEISLHANGTAAINAALGGLIRGGDHVITTAADHNSVLRPLAAMANAGRISLTLVGCDQNGLVDVQQISRALTKTTSLVAVTHASNVTGTVQPIPEIGVLLKDHSAILFCDAAQTLGYLDTDVEEFGVDVLAAPGHKGLLGPLGTGFLYVNESLHERTQPTVFGGTGSNSESLEMPTAFPLKLEAGNLNVPALAGLLAAIQYTEPTNQETETRFKSLACSLYDGLREIPGVTLFADRPEPKLPIASIALAGLAPQDLAMILDSEYGIETRAGLHCAAKIHEAIGSEQNGTLRISAGHSTSEQDVKQVVDAIFDIASKMS